MKLKKLVSIIAAIFVIAASSTGFAATWRHSRKGEVKLPSRAGKNDYYYQDFTGVEPGVLPSGFLGGSNSNGTHSTEITNVGGVEKNCYVLEDLSHEKGMGSTPTSSISLNNLKGLVGMEIRLKYEKTGSSNWSSLVIEHTSPEGMASRTVCASANGAFQFNYGGLGGAKVTNQIVPGNWYTFKYVLDFDLQLMDCEAIDEAAKKTTQVLQSQFYSATPFSNLSAISFRSSEFGGKWYVDYIRIYKAEDHIEEAEFTGKKGSADPVLVPGPKSLAIKGRTNIMMNGRYKFTTKAPKVNGDQVLVTAKNVASFFNLAYSVTDNGDVIKGDNVEFTIAKDGSGIKKDSSAMKLSASCVAEGKEIFIPIGDIAKELGYSYSYDAASDVVTLTAPAEEEVK